MAFKKKKKVIIENKEKNIKNIKVEHKIYLTLLAATITLTSISYTKIYPNYDIKKTQIYKDTITYKLYKKNIKDLNQIEQISTDLLNRHLSNYKYDENKIRIFIYNDKELNTSNQVASIELLETNEFVNNTVKEQIEIQKAKKEEKKKLLENFDLIDIDEYKKSNKTNKTLKISTKIDDKYYQYKIPFNQTPKFQLSLFSKGINIEDYLSVEEEEK